MHEKSEVKILELIKKEQTNAAIFGVLYFSVNPLLTYLCKTLEMRV